jgi:hypothetical protein
LKIDDRSEGGSTEGLAAVVRSDVIEKQKSIRCIYSSARASAFPLFVLLLQVIDLGKCHIVAVAPLEASFLSRMFGSNHSIAFIAFIAPAGFRTSSISTTAELSHSNILTLTPLILPFDPEPLNRLGLYNF